MRPHLFGDQGLEQVAPIAAKLGLKVLQGFWISIIRSKPRFRWEAAIELVNRYPDTVRALVVGNEVLPPRRYVRDRLAAMIRAVKARVKVPVTYADVWEFGCAARRSPRPSISSLSISCRIGRISRSRRARPECMST